MCTTCGCSDGAGATITEWDDDGGHAHHHLGAHGRDHSHGHDHSHAHDDHDHDHDHGHRHDHGHADSSEHFREHERAHAKALANAHATTVTLEQEVLAKNDRLAERNRGWLAGRGILALNLVSSPGAGKTTLLERTIRELGETVPISVVEGDQETVFDAERIRATGCRTVQVNTGTGCHLEAEMLGDALERLDPPMRSLVMIENVGNLVCPALFDLGEHAKVVILSVTEGDDKPLKYPHMFRAASLMVLNKTDLLPHLDFDVEACVARARRVNPEIEVVDVSATTGEGLDRWYAWLRQRLRAGGLEAAS